ncbi:glycerophosphoryl diester phosphodiesterase [Herbaspirillum sp. Sphag1AN]|uniref:glycerophosphodiester phosphodiesterase n=1 Tax=unclassified Herbaspirillum TaxID=2624150 RepID=UPI001607B4C0|nr:MULTISPECIES: glycerophosphodiester phosphodiesterase [unclassified Herbaspirillum]MBB3214331.1 glycerophosphoryl diester phosphodiesterase [Herbaspirillum sp. Sphag1AN]MBB3247383.1 glycerophosphoryl diester phosphodiesterase [Herbaspirillum sp. Sphag64]
MWPYPIVAAHRAGGTLAPENTLAAFRCGMDYGFRAVEFDVMLTADEQTILMHDAQFGRTLPGVGKVAEHTLAQLQKLDAGGWHSPAFKGETVCTLAQALLFCKDHGIWMNIEIKPSSDAAAARTGDLTGVEVAAFFADALAAYVPGQNDRSLPLFSSFSFDALMAAKKAAPGIPRGFLMDQVTPDWRERLQQLEAVALHTNHQYLTPALVQAIKQDGYGLFCYTVNDPVRAIEILDWGVDGFCTDRIDLIGPQ